MKELSYEDWKKNPTPRTMWVWNDDFEEREKRKVAYVLKDDFAVYPVLTVSEEDASFCLYCHCAEIEEPKTRRMTHKELSRWLRENPTREFVESKSEEPIFCHHSYYEDEAAKEVPEAFLIRENDGEWREPLVEEE